MATYLFVYTLNSKTSFLDKSLGKVGLEVVSLILKPAFYLEKKGKEIWFSYIYLVDLKKKNDLLTAEIDKLKLENQRLERQVATLQRFQSIFKLKPFPEYKYVGSEIIAKRLGPGGLLESIVVDKGKQDGIQEGDIVVSPQGIVGKIEKVATSSSIVLLACDPNSKIAVISKKNRTPGILEGRGYGNLANLLYVPKNTFLEKEEILVTSGTDEIFPAGIPVARIEQITQEEISLFLEVRASFLVDPYLLEEVLILKP